MKKSILKKNQLIDMPVFPSFQYVEPLTRNRKVLDLGCGTGRYLEKFSEESLGLDYSMANLKKCRGKGLMVMRADVNKKLSVKSEQFEVVFASHIIEHLKSPFNFLIEVNRVLESNGTLILGFPVEKSLARIWGDHYFNEHPGHLYSFSIEEIKRLFERTGFRLEKIFVDINFVGRFPILTPILYLANKLPLSLVLWWSNAVWIVAKKHGRI